MFYFTRRVINTYTYLFLLNFDSYFTVLYSSEDSKWENKWQLLNCTRNTTSTQFPCYNVQSFEERYFQCDNGACINEEFVCDSVKQCCDGSDEWAQTCNGPSSKIRKKRATGGHCAPPLSYPGTIFAYDCNDDTNSNSCVSNGSIREFTKVKVTCDSNYLALDEPGYESVCQIKKWWPSINRCYKKCDKLTPINVDLKCYRKNIEIDDCSGNSLRAGDRVQPTCKPLYKFNDFIPSYKEIICQEDGKWNKNLFTCTPEKCDKLTPINVDLKCYRKNIEIDDCSGNSLRVGDRGQATFCGRSFAAAQTLISNGVEESFGDSPWHVAIYNERRILICGGTIIHPLLILSAAHCFYTHKENGRLESADNFEVVVSKVTRNYSIVDNQYQKVFKIKEILLSDTKGYYDLANYHSADIAILLLRKQLTIQPTVLPACIDPVHKKWYPPEGTLAKVVGWGTTENNVLSERLRTANLPFISHKKCLETVPEDFKPYITLDKFCAGSEDGAGVLQGDSGGGYLFQESGFFFIRGIVSIKQPNDTKIAAFTDLADHIDWILSVRDEVDSKMNNGDVEKWVHHNEKSTYFDKTLLKLFYGNGSEYNIVLSPVSIKVMLAILLEGASGIIELEIKDALRLPQDKALALKTLQSQLQSLKNAYSSISLDSKIKLFVSSGQKISPSYINLITKNYDAEFEFITLGNSLNEDKTVDLVNNWIKNTTRGILGGETVTNSATATFADLNINSRTGLLLVNTIYLEINWKFAFDPKSTSVDIFYKNTTKSFLTEYMTTRMPIKYHSDEELKAIIVEIPLKGERYALTIVLPIISDAINRLLKDLNHVKLLTMLEEICDKNDTMVNVTLPKTIIQFKTSLHHKLSEIDIGIKEAISGKSNLNTDPRSSSLPPVGMFHTVKIAFNEKGVAPAPPLPTGNYISITAI